MRLKFNADELRAFYQSLIFQFAHLEKSKDNSNRMRLAIICELMKKLHSKVFPIKEKSTITLTEAQIFCILSCDFAVYGIYEREVMRGIISKLAQKVA